MNKPALIVALALAGSACLAPADDTGDAAPVEPARGAETSGALTADRPPALDPEAAEWLMERLPKWRVYLSGQDYYYVHGQKQYYETFRGGGDIVLVKEENLNEPATWIYLSLEKSQQRGEGYFDDLMREQHLAPEDLLGIAFALNRTGGSPPLLSTLTANGVQRGRERFQHMSEGEGTHGPPLPPGWDNDHRGGPSGTPTTPPHPSGGSTGPTPAPPHGPFNPADPSTWRPHPGSKADKKKKEQMKKEMELRYNGVKPGDPAPKPSPLDAGYTPSKGEEAEVFKCNGEVLVGYKRACPDFQAIPRATKWSEKIGEYLKRHDEMLREWARENLWAGGKGPECEDNCSIFANFTCLGFSGGLAATCVGLTGGAAGWCMSSVQGWLTAFGGGFYLSLECPRMVTNRCKKVNCNG
jgi:hypothetical protein